MFKDFPFYSQVDSEDCGPASLRMIAKYYGKNYTTQTLREHCFITREGVSMLGISDAAENIGFRTMGVCISYDQLAKEAILPCILHWNQNHFVVCYKINSHKNGNDDIYIADPASTKVVYKKEEFLKCWISTRRKGIDSGFALLLEPGPTFSKEEDERSTPMRRDLLFFARYLSPYKNLFAQLLLGMLVGSGIQLLFPFLTQSLVDVGIRGYDLDFVTLILIAQLSLFISQLSIGFIRGWIMLNINTRISISLISDFLAKLMRLPLRYFDTKRTGDILQRIGDHGRIKSFLMGSSINIIFSTFNFFLFAFILGFYSISILTLFIVGNFLYVVWVNLFMHRRRELDIKRFNQSASEQGNLIQLVQGMQDIKLNNCEKLKRWEWERIQVKIFKIGVKGLSLEQVQQAGATFFTQGTDILITFIAAKSVINGNMTLGMMMSLTYIVGQLSTLIGDLINFMRALQDAKISLERLNEVHRKKDEDYHVISKRNTLPKDKSIRLIDAKFSYSGAMRGYALDGISINIPEKKVTAIVGESGSGKSTLIKLILGFYNLNSGSITVGDCPLNSINPHLWRGKIGAVMQESYIFSDTIARNIAISTENIDQERLEHAIKVACIDDFINTLPLGYNTRIGMEGNGISQGQKQRILIARAVYKDPDYIFLDEATNSLDSINEKNIMKQMEEFYHGKTVVIAAHRLSTVMNADNIIVLSKGKIIEQGSHRSLTEKRGAYYKLVKNQLELGC